MGEIKAADLTEMVKRADEFRSKGQSILRVEQARQALLSSHSRVRSSKVADRIDSEFVHVSSQGAQ